MIMKSLKNHSKLTFFDRFDDHLHINLFNFQRKNFDCFSRAYIILKKQFYVQNLFQKKMYSLWGGNTSTNGVLFFMKKIGKSRHQNKKPK